MKALSFAIFAEIIVRTVGTAIPDSTNGYYTATIAATASMNICVASCGIFGNSEKQLYYVLAIALIGLWRLEPIEVKLLLKGRIVSHGFSICQRPREYRGSIVLGGDI